MHGLALDPFLSRSDRSRNLWLGTKNQGDRNTAQESADMRGVRDVRVSEAVEEGRDDGTCGVNELVPLAPVTHREDAHRAKEPHDRSGCPAGHGARARGRSISRKVPDEQRPEVDGDRPRATEARLDERAGVEKANQIQPDVQDVEVDESGRDQSPPFAVLHSRPKNRPLKGEGQNYQPAADLQISPSHLIGLVGKDGEQRQSDHGRDRIASNESDHRTGGAWAASIAFARSTSAAVRPCAIWVVRTMRTVL